MYPKILLLQARTQDDPARLDERRSFAERTGLPVENIVPFDLLAKPLDAKTARQYDALMAGGSGEYYVSKGNLPFLQETLQALAEIAHSGHPVFASCFGFQLLVVALGGSIVFDAENMEVGTFEISLTEAGRRDELLHSMPDKFFAQLGHKDRADSLPDGCINLAYSERAPIQAFRIPGKPVWATQFHPELDGIENRARFYRYLAGYAAHMNEAEKEATLANFHDSPATEHLLHRFLDRVLHEK